jgi:hypothetical protein
MDAAQSPQTWGSARPLLHWEQCPLVSLTGDNLINSVDTINGQFQMEGFALYADRCENWKISSDPTSAS